MNVQTMLWLLVTLCSIASAVMLNTMRLKWIYVAFKTLPRDIRISILYYKLHRIGVKMTKDNLSLDKAFALIAQKQPDSIAFYFEDEEWTYKKVNELSYKITNYFINENYVQGDTVALLMENCPQYACIFLGLSRIGVTTALVNTNVVKSSLLNLITMVKPKGLILEDSFKNTVEEIAPRLQHIKLYQLNNSQTETEVQPGSINLLQELNETSSTPVKPIKHSANISDPLVYIYTSGTTGLPKASVLTHSRYLMGSKGFATVANVKQDDVVYTALPLYHIGGGMLGLGQALVTGVPVVLKKKFSASSYFSDCAKYNVTVAQYIGEMCRYLLSNSTPAKHNIRVMIGNGLKPQIWVPFMEKFGIKNIVEAYGATEGSTNLVNIDNRVGAVGCMPWFMRKKFPVLLIKCDENGKPLRNSRGLCIVCDVDEAGVAVGKIDPSKALLNYDGYTDKYATQAKLLRGVLELGDLYFISGDILVQDELGYFYFKDRTGDTFRWKGENVSTTEVEALISNLVQLADVIVYGVSIPNTEGKAGMAVIVDPCKNLDIEKLGSTLKYNLPSYAVPIFIRIVDSVPVTSTFKMKKALLKDENYDLERIKDTIYFFDPSLKKYVIFNGDIYKSIKNGTLKL